MADDSTRAGRRFRPILLTAAAAVVLLLATAAGWWLQRPGDEAPDDSLYRVDEACLAWMGHRPALREALDDTFFGVEGMHEASRRRGVDIHLPDPERTHETLRSWEEATATLLETLRLEEATDSLERQLVHRLRGSRFSTRELRELLPNGTGSDVLDHREWLEDSLNRIDDVCIRAAYR